jgi:CHAT domain-containing protein
MRGFWSFAVLFGFLSGAAIPADSPYALEQRLAAARAELVAADARKPPQPDLQAAAIERLVDLLDEATQLDTDEAQTLVERDLALRPAATIAHAAVLERSARVMYAQGRLDRALSTAQDALAVVHSQDGDHADAEAPIRAMLGIILCTQYKYADAVPPLEASVAWFDAHDATGARPVFALQSLALSYAKLGKRDLAQSALDRANARATALEGPDGGLTALGLSLAADFQDDAGNYATALASHERALALLHDARPARAAAYAHAHMRYAWTMFVSGNTERAGKLFLEGIAAEEPHPTSGGAALASNYYGYGYYLFSHERYEEAAGYLRRALALAQKIYGADADGSVFVETVLAKTLRNMGKYDEAVPLLQHAIAITDRAPAGSYAGTSSVRSLLGDIYVWQGHYAEAEQLFRTVLERIGPGHDVGHAHPRAALEGIAASAWAQGHDADGFAAAVATERSRQKMLRTAGADLGEQHSIALKQYQRGGFDWVVAIAAKSAKAEQVREAWDLALESQGLISTINARRLAVARAASDPKLIAVWKKWKDSDEAFVQARLEAARNPSLATSNALDAAEQRFDNAERELAHTIGTGGATLEHAHLGIAPVLAALPNDTLLASYVDVNSSEPADLDKPTAQRHGRLYVFTARRGATPQLIDLGPRPPIESAVKAWLDLVTDRNADADRRDAAGRRVRELIWDPVAARWPQKRVFVVPSVQIERVPFPALPADGKYLVEAGYTFHLLDHERDVLAPSLAKAQPTLALIGAPDFSVDARTADSGTRGVCAGLRGASFTALPQAEREIDNLRSLWSQRSGVATPLVLTGADATEARARAALGKSTIIHFATHGLYLGAECGDAPGDGRGLKNVDTRKPAADTPDISALVLSGANRPATSSENDGLLTAEEIAALDLSNTDWAVLSACDTGIGTNVRGEGVFGLRRAFRLAGAHTVVMSLWPVSDAASADWMLALYRARVQQHASTIDSVRAADLALIKQRRDAGLDPAPYYWAAFVAAGDWR